VNTNASPSLYIWLKMDPLSLVCIRSREYFLSAVDDALYASVATDAADDDAAVVANKGIFVATLSLQIPKYRPGQNKLLRLLSRSLQLALGHRHQRFRRCRRCRPSRMRYEMGQRHHARVPKVAFLSGSDATLELDGLTCLFGDLFIPFIHYNEVVLVLVEGIDRVHHPLAVARGRFIGKKSG
jgi:hypothetical protein